MDTLSCAFWGMVGGLLVEAVELIGAIKRTGRWPWRYPGEPGIGPTLAAIILRAMAGGALAAALGADGQIGGSFTALTVGISAPLVIQKLARQVPVYLPTVSGQREANSRPPAPGPESLQYFSQSIPPEPRRQVEGFRMSGRRPGPECPGIGAGSTPDECEDPVEDLPNQSQRNARRDLERRDLEQMGSVGDSGAGGSDES